jgi:hypothetical protein
MKPKPLEDFKLQSEKEVQLYKDTVLHALTGRLAHGVDLERSVGDAHVVARLNVINFRNVYVK